MDLAREYPSLLGTLDTIFDQDCGQVGDGRLFSCAYGQLIDARLTQRVRLKLYSEYLNQTEATKRCEKQGAVLTGLESTAERDHLWTFNVEGLTKVWINGIRRKGCRLIGVMQFPAGCDGLAGFNFTDKLLSKKEGLSWTEHNPDGLRYELSDIYQDCLVLWIRPNQKLIDDVLCNSYLDPNEIM